MQNQDNYESNSWSEYRRLVTSGLKDLDEDIKNLDKKFERQLRELADKLESLQLQVTRDITQLQTKAGIWGGVVGLVVSLIATVIAELIVKK
jgi:hypothetical protein